MDHTLARYNAMDVLATRLILRPLQEEAQEAQVHNFYHERVLPLAQAVQAMARHGLHLDQARRTGLIEEYQAAQATARGALPPDLNPNARRQVGQWIANTLKLPLSRVTPTGQAATDEDTLRFLAEKYQSLELLRFLEYTEVSKLLGTYLVSLPLHEDGRVHCQWLVHGTATGRLSSRRPNFQNQPRDIRVIYTAEPGWRLAEFDYDQIELRLMAHLAQDVRLLESFATGRDEHGLNAQFLFDLDAPATKDGPTSGLRDFAKVPLYGVVLYGGSPRTITLDPRKLVGVPGGRKHVEEWSQWYFRQHPQISTWRQATMVKAAKEGRLYNWAGRIRIFFGHEHKRMRAACNFPIQSGAADIINQALVAIHQAGKSACRVVAQIHDALLVEYRGEFPWWVQEIMERSVEIDGQAFNVPVTPKDGTCWGELTHAHRARSQ